MPPQVTQNAPPAFVFDSPQVPQPFAQPPQQQHQFQAHFPPPQTLPGQPQEPNGFFHEPKFTEDHGFPGAIVVGRSAQSGNSRHQSRMKARWAGMTRRKKWIIIVSVVVLVLLIALGVGLGVGLKKKSQGASLPANANIEQIMQYCAASSDCANDSRNMATLVACGKTDFLATACCNAIFGLSDTCRDSCIGQTAVGGHFLLVAYAEC